VRGIDLARGGVRVEVRRRVEVRGGVEVRGRVRVRARDRPSSSARTRAA